MTARWTRRPLTLLAFLALAATLCAAALAWSSGLRLVRVTDLDMHPSLLPGEWLLCGPGPLERGDVVRLRDPLEPGRALQRRVLALPGETIAFTGYQARVGGRALKHQLMGDLGQEMVLMEDMAWLLAVSHSPTRYRHETLTVPDGHVFLVADHRDVAMDSRWWGPIPEHELLDRVRWRLGSSDVWRPWLGRASPVIRPEVLLPGRK